MLFNYNQHNVENNPYFRDSSQFPYAAVPKYEQMYPQFPLPPQYTNGVQSKPQGSGEYGMQNQNGGTIQPNYQQNYGYPLPYPMQGTEESYVQTPQYGYYQQYQNQQQQSQDSGNYQYAPSQYYQGYASNPMGTQQPTATQYGPFTPYPQSKKNQQKQPSQVNNFLSQFKNTNGDMDVNKMMNTAGTMMNAFSQLGGLAKQVGGFFIK